MNRHYPDLYLFLCLLTGLAALLAIIYAFCRRKPGQCDGPEYLKKAKPLDGVQRDRPRPIESNESSRYATECKRLARLARPQEKPIGWLDLAAEWSQRALSSRRLMTLVFGQVPALNKLTNRFRSRFTLGEVQRRAQRSHTRL